ncbi:MAG: putative hydrolase of the metallo-beta-lactamase superfamily, partial [Acidimicrobiales bacterium]|nr:putative hydrolase of the metallo-beta-lactamase superfamily [Acidimicrobiales bacterium]
GLGEIGRNCAAIEIDGKIMLLDCGLMFPEADMLGVDLVLPDFSWLLERGDDIVGCVVTHGHEDHHGALAFLLRELSFPIIGSALTLGFASNRIDEAGLMHKTKLLVVKDNERRKFGTFDCEFIPVTHSVPHGFATAFHTPQGTILHSGDWKLDLTPVDGRHTDLGRIGAIEVEEGIRLLLADSTNAEEKGYTRSESSMRDSLRNIFAANAKRRIVIACFASHIHRIQQIADVAIAQGRMVVTLGLSMKKNQKLARDLGLLDIPDKSITDIADLDDLAPEKVCVISTGSQGEPMSALSRMASNDNKWIRIGADDTVILSSHPIPGNETSVGKVIDGLHRLGAEVIHSGIADVHVSGHAKSEEIKTLLALARPEWFVPVHGEYRHLVHHGRLGELMGVEKSNVVISLDGDQLELSDTGLAKVGEVPAGYLYVDGAGLGDVGHGVLRDRRILAEEGVVVVIVTVDVKSGEVIAGPEIITRGWVYAPEAEDLLEEARAAVVRGIEEADETDVETIRRHARKALGQFVSDRTRRRPMIVPVVMEA